MFRQFSTKLFLTLFIGLTFTFCSDPVKVGEDSDNITISNVVINNYVDEDGDNYYSSVNLSFTISTESEKSLHAYIGYKGSEDSQYQTYGLYYSFNANGTESVSITIGTSEHELPGDCYEFVLWIYDESDTEFEELLASISALDEDNLSLCMESYEQDQPIVAQLIFENQCPTEVRVITTNFGSITIPEYSTNSYNFYSDPGTITFSASTQLSIGQNLVWNNKSVNLTGKSSYTYLLGYNNTIFFATITNNGGSARSNFYMNYGLDDQYFVDINVPNDGIKRSLGYYGVHGIDTEILCWSVGAEQWYNWTNLNFSEGNNQVINLTSTLPKTSGNGQFLSEFKPTFKANEKTYIEAP